MHPTTEEARGARLRRAARRMGYRLHRSRWRLGTIDNYGDFQIIDANNWIVAGERFNMTAADVEVWLRS